MDINFSNIGIRNGTVGANGIEIKGTQAETHRANSVSANLTIGIKTEGISSGEPVIAVPDAELTRDDKLGQLVSAAFNLPPPPMPDFS